MIQNILNLVSLQKETNIIKETINHEDKTYYILNRTIELRVERLTL